MIFAYNSDVGCKRTNNEDFYYVPKAGIGLKNVAIVADGMGGYNAGEVASQSAVENVVKYLEEYGEDITLNSIRSAIRRANNDIMEMVKADIRLKGMGTTMTVAVFMDNQVLIGHVGDSRAYVISKSNIKQLTKDHSYVQMLIDNGEITLEEAYNHKYKNVITRAVGVDRRVKIDAFEYNLQEGDMVFLCSDGLVKYVSDEEIRDNLKPDMYDGVQRLVEIAKDRGGDDNITIVAGLNRDVVFDNRYRVVQQIGSGGMSRVFYGEDMQNGNSPVSIKLLKKELFKDEKIREMFKREAKTAIKLKHKNIINAKCIVEEKDKTYIILEFVEGTNLKDYMEQHGPIDEVSAINIALQVARALRFAHNSGYIHKDVKPQNIIIDENMNAFLTDFGLATKQEEKPTGDADKILGSVYYFSPEHAKGETVNMRSDIYSLGIVIYEMLTGDLPFKGDSTHEVIMGHIHQNPVSPNEYNRNISVGISQVILKAIDKDCLMRYVNFNNFMADMKQALKHPEGGFVEYKYVPLSSTASTFDFRKLAIGTAVMLSLVGVLFIFSFITRETVSPKANFGMPNLLNMNMNDAIFRLDEMDVPYRIEYYERDTGSSGVVLEQSVRQNTEIPPGTTVVLGVSINNKENKMPNFYRMNRNDVVSYLNSANISNISIEYVDSELPYNFVVSQTPDSNTNLENVKRVTLQVSNNNVEMEVPKLINLSLEEAKKLAADNGFSIGIVYEEEEKAQKVNRQLPVNSSFAVDNLAIDVWVGKDPKKTVAFSTTLNLTVKEDDTKVVVCYEEEDGSLYYVNEFVLKIGIYQRKINFTALDNSPKKVHVFQNNIASYVVDGVEADN